MVFLVKIQLWYHVSGPCRWDRYIPNCLNHMWVQGRGAFIMLNTACKSPEILTPTPTLHADMFKNLAVKTRSNARVPMISSWMNEIPPTTWIQGLVWSGFHDELLRIDFMLIIQAPRTTSTTLNIIWISRGPSTTILLIRLWWIGLLGIFWRWTIVVLGLLRGPLLAIALNFRNWYPCQLDVVIDHSFFGPLGSLLSSSLFANDEEQYNCYEQEEAGICQQFARLKAWSNPGSRIKSHPWVFLWTDSSDEPTNGRCTYDKPIRSGIPVFVNSLTYLSQVSNAGSWFLQSSRFLRMLRIWSMIERNYGWIMMSPATVKWWNDLLCGGVNRL